MIKDGTINKQRVIEEIHLRLGGDGWAYSNYGYNELKSHREELESVADLIIELAKNLPHPKPNQPQNAAD